MGKQKELTFFGLFVCLFICFIPNSKYSISAWRPAPGPSAGTAPPSLHGASLHPCPSECEAITEQLHPVLEGGERPQRLNAQMRK